MPALRKVRPRKSRRRANPTANKPSLFTVLRNAAMGGFAGLLATAPMTLVMNRLHRSLPAKDQQAIPPSRITAALESAVTSGTKPSHEQHQTLTMVAHYGYGAAMGSLFGAAATKWIRPTASTGVLFGLGVWAASYLAFLPAAGLHEPATEESPGRNEMMIAAHVVWGAILGEIIRQAWRDDT